MELEGKSLAEIGTEILKRFPTLIQTVSQNQDDSISQSQAQLQDEFDRFQLFAANLSLIHSGHSSLDYRLREADLLESSVRRLLRDLVDSLDEGSRLCHQDLIDDEKSEPPGQLSKNGEPVDEEDGAAEEDELLEAGYGEGTEGDVPAINLILESISDSVDRLFKLATKVRNPTTRQIASRVYSYQDVDEDTGIDVIAEYAKYDHQHITELFGYHDPSLLKERNYYLIDRLSRANTFRRQQFGYWRRRRRKLHIPPQRPRSVAIPGINIQLNAATNSKEPLEPIKALSQVATSKPYTASMLDASKINFDSSQSTVSLSEYAPTTRGLNNETIEWPLAPSKLKGKKYFECPYCFTLCASGYLEKRAWKTHILCDLRPYVCTYDQCIDGDRLYETQRDWLAHESSMHRRIWRCLEHSDLTFEDRSRYEKHLQDEHQHEVHLQSSELVKAAKSTSKLSDRPCPFCQTELVSATALQDHIAYHLERVALFALPRSTGIEDESISSGSWSGQAAVQNHSLSRNENELESLSAFSGASRTSEKTHLTFPEEQTTIASAKCPSCDGNGFSTSRAEDCLIDKEVRQTTKNIFSVTVVRAEGLYYMDTVYRGAPYVVLTDGYRRKLGKTRTQHALSWHWGETFRLTSYGSPHVYITVWNYNKKQDHECLGSTSLKLNLAHFDISLPRDYWLDLDPRGRILIRVSFSQEAVYTKPCDACQGSGISRAQSYGMSPGTVTGSETSPQRFDLDALKNLGSSTLLDDTMKVNDYLRSIERVSPTDDSIRDDSIKGLVGENDDKGKNVLKSDDALSHGEVVTNELTEEDRAFCRRLQGLTPTEDDDTNTDRYVAEVSELRSMLDRRYTSKMKTANTLDMLAYLIESKAKQDTFIISVLDADMDQWQSTLAIWAPRTDILTYLGSQNARERLRYRSFSVLITTHTYLDTDRSILALIKWKHMIRDEPEDDSILQSSTPDRLPYYTGSCLTLTQRREYALNEHPTSGDDVSHTRLNKEDADWDQFSGPTVDDGGENLEAGSASRDLESPPASGLLPFTRPIFPVDIDQAAPWAQLRACSDSFYGTVLPLYVNFIQQPPLELEAREKEGERLRDSAMDHVIRADMIRTRDNREAGLVKDKIIHDARAVGNWCEAVASETGTGESKRAQAEPPVLDYTGLDAEQQYEHLLEMEEKEQQLSASVLGKTSKWYATTDEEVSAKSSLRQKLAASAGWSRVSQHDLQAIRSRLHLLEARCAELEKIEIWMDGDGSDLEMRQLAMWESSVLSDAPE